MNIPIELKDKIGRIVNLPTLPQVACNLLESINDAKSSSCDIASIIGHDLSLSAKIIRLSNSAFYGMPRTIANINEAIVILGFRAIYIMVLSLTVFDMFPDRKLLIKFNRKTFWKHSILCGLISKLIVKKLPKKFKISPEDAFCAGLLHDIGKIVMEQYLHDDMHKALEYSKKSQTSYFHSEKAMLGYTHTQVTKLLIMKWNLPQLLISPLIHHHNPDVFLSNNKLISLKPHMVHTFICHLADYLCFDEQIRNLIKEDTPPPPLNEDVMDVLELSPKNIEEIRMIIPEEIEKMREFIVLFSL